MSFLMDEEEGALGFRRGVLSLANPPPSPGWRQQSEDVPSIQAWCLFRSHSFQTQESFVGSPHGLSGPGATMYLLMQETGGDARIRFRRGTGFRAKDNACQPTEPYPTTFTFWADC